MSRLSEREVNFGRETRQRKAWRSGGRREIEEECRAIKTSEETYYGRRAKPRE